MTQRYKDTEYDGMVPVSNGDWVRWEDVISIEAEIARLRESASCMEGWLQKMECQCGPRSVCARCIALANGPTALAYLGKK